MVKKGSSWARIIGHGLAHLQDGVDQLVEYGFQKMKNVDIEPEPKLKRSENKYLFAAKKFTKRSLAFLGESGDSFYKKYEELKRKRKSS